MNNPKEPTLVFPCEVPIKVFGKNTPEFIPQVQLLVKKHFPEFKEETIQTRPSQKNNYIGLTVLVMAQSRSQLDALYLDLSKDPLILMIL